MRDKSILSSMKAASLGVVNKVVLRAARFIYDSWTRGGDGTFRFPRRLKEFRDYKTKMCKEMAIKREIMVKAFAPQVGKGGHSIATAATKISSNNNSDSSNGNKYGSDDDGNDDYSRASGGLFIAPNVSHFFGLKVKRKNGEGGGEVTINAENFPQLLYDATGVVVNSGRWCYDTNLVRVVFSIDIKLVHEAARRVEEFRKGLRE